MKLLNIFAWSRTNSNSRLVLIMFYHHSSQNSSSVYIETQFFNRTRTQFLYQSNTKLPNLSKKVNEKNNLLKMNKTTFSVIYLFNSHNCGVMLHDTHGSNNKLH